MSDEIRVNRPQQPMQGGMQQQPMMRQDAPMMEDGGKKGSKLPWIILAVVVVIIVVVGVLFRTSFLKAQAAKFWEQPPTQWNIKRYF